MATRTHIVVGAGPVGSALALELATAGERVRVVTRSGGGPVCEGVERVAADASDPAALSQIARDADVLYNCANPGSYTEWETAWPALAGSILTAAEASGAVLVTAGNLYAYGPVDAPMTAGTPLTPSDHKGALRARLWADALEAHRAGRVRASEVRASDYIGPTVPVANGLLPMYAARTLAGRAAAVFGDPDQPHSWTAVGDVARTLAVVGAREDAWGRAWIAPTNPPSSVRDVLRRLGAHAATGEPRLRRVPRWVLRTGGVAVPLLREVVGVLYQFERPFEVDSAETTAALGVSPTDWAALIAATADAWHRRATR